MPYGLSTKKPKKVKAAPPPKSKPLAGDAPQTRKQDFAKAKVEHRTQRHYDARRTASYHSPQAVKARGNKKEMTKVVKSSRKRSDKLAWDNYSRHMRHLYRKIGDQYFGKTEPLHLRVEGDPRSDGEGYAYVYQDDKDKVYFGNDVLRDFMGERGPKQKKYAALTPIHEWAHTRQPKGNPEWWDEGQAELLAEWISSVGLNKRYPGGGGDYPMYTALVFDKKGSKYEPHLRQFRKSRR